MGSPTCLRKQLDYLKDNVGENYRGARSRAYRFELGVTGSSRRPRKLLCQVTLPISVNRRGCMRHRQAERDPDWASDRAAEPAASLAVIRFCALPRSLPGA